jgi:hypothetical protein
MKGYQVWLKGYEDSLMVIEAENSIAARSVYIKEHLKKFKDSSKAKKKEFFQSIRCKRAENKAVKELL